MSELPDFPFLPGAFQQDDWSEMPTPPRFVTLTLKMLADGHAVEQSPPQEWVDQLCHSNLDHGLSEFLARGLGLYGIQVGPGVYEWFERTRCDDGSMHESRVTEEHVISKAWREFASHVESAATAQYGSPKSALDTILRKWGEVAAERKRVRTAYFEAEWRDAASWEPGLALHWLLYGGNWEAIAEAVDYGANIPARATELTMFGAFRRTDPRVTNAAASSEFKRRTRHNTDHPERIVLLGMHMGNAPLREIDPRELQLLEWGDAQRWGQNTVLKQGPFNQQYFTNVIVDRISLTRRTSDLKKGANESNIEYLARLNITPPLYKPRARELARANFTSEEEIEEFASSLQGSLRAKASRDNKGKAT